MNIITNSKVDILKNSDKLNKEIKQQEEKLELLKFWNEEEFKIEIQQEENILKELYKKKKM